MLKIYSQALAATLSELAEDAPSEKNWRWKLDEIARAREQIGHVVDLLERMEWHAVRASPNARLLRLLKVRQLIDRERYM